MAKINISIPQPCHENWENMKPENQGRFCDSCQKKVFDFTKSSDREIVNAFQQSQNLCGRFLNTQLNRDLIKPEKKNPVWLATASAVISFVGLGTQEAIAQKTTKTEQTNRKVVGKPAAPETVMDTVLVSGIVYDDNKTPMPHLGIYCRGLKIGQTNGNGNFSVITHVKAKISFRGIKDDDLELPEYYVVNGRNSNVEINAIRYTRHYATSITGAVCVKSEAIVKRRTFFGRIFHAIGNLFK